MKKWALTCLAMLLALSSTAQNLGQLSGYVRQALNGEALSDWTVHVISSEQEVQTTTDPNGYFSFSKLPTGLCNVRAVSPSGQQLTIHEVLITSAKPTDLTIEVERQYSSLDEVIVTAQAFQTTKETPLAIKNINWSEMQRMPGATLDLSKVIQSFPGVLPKPSFGYAISLRGGASSENAYLLDDVVLPTINHFSLQGASGGAVALVNLDHVQDMALITGAFPVEVGDVSSGILNLTGRNGRKDHWGSRITLGATDYGITMEGPVGESSSLIASARNSFSQHYFKLFNIPVLPAYQDVQLRWHQRIGDRADLAIIGLAGWDQYELYLKGDGSDALMYNIGYIPEGEQTIQVLGARYRQYTDNGYWQAVLSQDNITNDAEKFIGNTGDEADLQKRYSAYETNRRMTIKHFVAWGPWTLNYGGNLTWRNYGIDSWGYRQLLGGTAVSTLQDTLQFSTAAAFTSMSRTWLDDRLTTSIGFRAESHDLNATTRLMSEQFSPRASVSYQISPSWTANSNWTISHQLPPATLLLANGAHDRMDAIRAGRVQHLGGGVEYQNGQTYRVSMEVYHKNYDQAAFLLNDQIPFAQAIGSYVAVGDQIWDATAEGRARGMELFLQQKLKGNYWWMASYNLGWSDVREAGSDTWRPSVWDSRHHISATWGKVWGKGWQAGVKWRYSSGTTYTPFDSATSSLRSNWDVLQRGVFDYSQAGMARLGNVVLMDARIDKTYIRKGYTIQWFLDIQNITSSTYPLMPYLTVERDADGQPVVHPDDPTRYVVKTIESDTGRSLPTIGVIIEF